MQPAVEVAHRPREGACVLRYRFARQDGRPAGRPRRVLYGKVYADDRGQRVDGYLRSLERDRLARHSTACGAVPHVGGLPPGHTAPGDLGAGG